ncbi:electron transporter [Atractiella rhizophila]|nr:electron transporter [Atractiella rhizophila]
MALSNSDLFLLAIVAIVGFWYLFKDNLGSADKKTAALLGTGKDNKLGDVSGGDSRNFVEAMEKAKKRIVIFYGSQTGTAEDYATRLAREAKSKYGISSLVADPEEYDFECLDAVPEDHLVIFVMATYGEGEPTDNAIGLMDFLKEDSPQFSKGGDLSNLKFVVFALGNRTYEQFCAIGRIVDERLTALGAKRIGERGEGDDDKSMEEDYLAWKDGMWEAVQKEMGFEEGQGGDIPDFDVQELTDGNFQEEKVFLGELSQRALTGSRGVYDAKNPYPSPLVKVKELFSVDSSRNCVFAEFDIKDTGIRYQAGDHVGVFPINPDNEVDKLIKVLGLTEKAHTVIDIKPLDPTLAKVPFPIPTTYETVIRYYIDICALASRQSIGSFAKFAPTDEARAFLEKIAEVLIMAAGGDYHDENSNFTVWNVPFDRVISGISRLQPRYYSISSSPKLHPDSIHVTAVVLKYSPGLKDPLPNSKYIFGVGTNYLLNLKLAASGEISQLDNARTTGEDTPRYKLEGPRNKYFKEGAWRVPIHVRRSNFRLPTSPKIPVVMVGPGTGVAPFRGFVQERVALARKAKEKDGEGALKDWGNVILFYGCRQADDDFLYKDEWEEYAKELDGKLKLYVAFSRQPGQPKIYVQKLIDEKQDEIAEALVTKKGYAYICGDARHMAREVEAKFEEILAKAKGGSREDGAKELKLLKDRNRLLLDVWS